MELALRWSGYEERAADFELSSVCGGLILQRAEARRRIGRLFMTVTAQAGVWLEYNIKRVLGIDCGADEKELGISRSAKRWSKSFIMWIGRQQFWTAWSQSD